MSRALPGIVGYSRIQKMAVSTTFPKDARLLNTLMAREYLDTPDVSGYGAKTMNDKQIGNSTQILPKICYMSLCQNCCWKYHPEMLSTYCGSPQRCDSCGYVSKLALTQFKDK